MSETPNIIEIIKGFEINGHTIRKTDETRPRVSVYDLITVLTNDVCARKTFARLSFIYTDLRQLEYYKFEGRGQKNTPIVHVDCIPRLIKIILSKSCLPISKKNEWYRKIGECEYIHMSIRTEAELLDIINKAFKKIEKQIHFHVKPYFVDMYFPLHRLVVECDEHGHVGYDTVQEAERTKFITTELQCSWVRFDPYANGFNIGDVIAEIGLVVPLN
jgi:very-short-patch-repair endonuclease